MLLNQIKSTTKNSNKTEKKLYLKHALFNYQRNTGTIPVNDKKLIKKKKTKHKQALVFEPNFDSCTQLLAST